MKAARILAGLYCGAMLNGLAAGALFILGTGNAHADPDPGKQKGTWTAMSGVNICDCTKPTDQCFCLS